MTAFLDAEGGQFFVLEAPATARRNEPSDFPPEGERPSNLFLLVVRSVVFCPITRRWRFLSILRCVPGRGVLWRFLSGDIQTLC